MSVSNLVIYTTHLSNNNTERPQIRHLSYCRKSKTRPPKSRKKACVQCTKAKTQCEVQSVIGNRQIQCSRCRTKGIDCHFERPPFTDTIDSSAISTSTLESVLEIDTDSLSKTNKAHVEYLNSTYETVEIPNYDLALPDSRNDPSESSSSAVELFQVSTNATLATDLWTENINASGYEELMSGDFFYPGTPGSFLYSDGQYCPRYPQNDIFGASIPHQISPKPPKSFLPSRERDPRLQLTRRYIVCVIKSYPNMLSEHKLPPFIHPSCMPNQPNSSLDISLPRPLLVCAGIVQMFNLKSKSSTAFIWKIIRMEQERLAAEVFYFAHL